MQLLVILAIALALLAALFAIQNSGVVTVTFLGWSWDASLALVLIVVLGAGVLIGYLAALPSSLRKGSQLRQHRRKVDDLERAVSDLEEPLEPSSRDDSE